MKNTVFGEIDFNMGWESKTKIVLFFKEYEIIVNAAAFYENDLVTVEQEKSYREFFLNQKVIRRDIEQLLMETIKNPAELANYKPVLLKFDRNGNYGLVFDDVRNIDGGLVITIKPEYSVLSPDQYL